MNFDFFPDFFKPENFIEPPVNPIFEEPVDPTEEHEKC